MSHRRKKHEYSDSDEAVGKTMDYSSSSEDRKPKHKAQKVKVVERIIEKPVEKPPPPPQEKPKRQRLSAARRSDIIAKFQQGYQDPEYEVTFNEANKSYKVAKRKVFTSPTANINTVAPPQHDIHLTYMNMQQEMNQSLRKEIKKLRKDFETIAPKYEEKKKAKSSYAQKRKPLEEEEEEPPPIERPIERPPPQTMQNPLRLGQYQRHHRIDIRGF
jgi:hypothetical protein